MESFIPIPHASLAFLDLYTPKNDIERGLKFLERFVRRYVPNARSITFHTKLVLNRSSYGYSFTYELEGVTAYLADGEIVNVAAAVQERLRKEGAPSTKDPAEGYIWELAFLKEDDSLMNELLEPLVWVLADPFAHEPKVTINLEDLERNLAAVEGVAVVKPGLVPCRGLYPVAARNDFFKFVRRHVPDARKVNLKFTYEYLDYGDALYPNYSVAGIEVVKKDGTTVRLDKLLDEKFEKDPDAAQEVDEGDSWTAMFSDEDGALESELLAPLVRGYAQDPYAKEGALEFEL